jgi:hypothetical protein
MSYVFPNFETELSVKNLTPDTIKQKAYLSGIIPPQNSCIKIYEWLKAGHIKNPESIDFESLYVLLEWCMILKVKIRTTKCLMTLLIQKCDYIEYFYMIVLMGLNYDHSELEICMKEPNLTFDQILEASLAKILTWTIFDSAPYLLAALMSIKQMEISEKCCMAIYEHAAKNLTDNRTDRKTYKTLLMDSAISMYMIMTKKCPDSKSIVDIKTKSPLIDFIVEYGKKRGLTLGIIKYDTLRRWANTGVFLKSFINRSVSSDEQEGLIAGAFFNDKLVAYSSSTDDYRGIKYVEASIAGRSIAPLCLFYLMAVLHVKKLTQTLHLENAAEPGRRHVYEKLGFDYEDDDYGKKSRYSMRFDDFKYKMDQPKFVSNVIKNIHGNNKLKIREYDILSHAIEVTKDPYVATADLKRYKNFVASIFDEDEESSETSDLEIEEDTDMDE